MRRSRRGRWSFLAAHRRVASHHLDDPVTDQQRQASAADKVLRPRSPKSAEECCASQVLPSMRDLFHYMRGAFGFCCQRATRVPDGSSNIANHPWPMTSVFGEMIFPPAFLTFS